MPTDQDYMKMALHEAGKAFTQNEVPIGAVLVQGGQIVARAHNAPMAANDSSAHAEMLAIRRAWKGPAIEGGGRALCDPGALCDVCGRHPPGETGEGYFRRA